MSLPVERLDDRRFQDIVDEAKQKITTYCPEWTNHNVSDPGVALIELFAWMTDLTLFQLNKVPEREMRVLLNSVGFELFPAQAATTELTFRLAAGYRDEVIVPAQTRVAAPLDGQEMFATEGELRIVQPSFQVCRAETESGALTESPETEAGPDGVTRIAFDDGLVCFQGLEAARVRWTRDWRNEDPILRDTWSPPDRFRGEMVNFGFERPLARAVVRAAFEVAAVSGLGIDPDHPPLIWEASTATGWERCEVGRDTTGGLNRTGEMDVQVGALHEPMILEAGQRELYWLRMRVDLRNREAQTVYHRSPEIRSVAFTTIGGTIPAVNAVRRERQEVGISDGLPGQRVRLERSVMGGDHTVEVHVGANRWEQRDDFAGATENDLVFVADEAAGEIVFGPRVHQASGEPRQHGAIPPAGEVIMASYSTGGGRAGDVGRGRITSMQTAISGVASVQNLSAASGGVDRETVPEALQRAPATVRAGDRAVTVGDFERIVRDAARDLHTVACRPPAAPGDPVRILIVPTISTPASEQTIDDFALPRPLCDRITAHLEPRRLVGTSVELTTPFYLGVSVVVSVRRSGQSVSTHGLQDTILRALYTYINPLEGGDAGAGLGFGEVLTAERIEDRIRHVKGVERVVDVAMFEVDLRQGRRVSAPSTRIAPPPDTLFMSYHHHVVFDDGNES